MALPAENGRASTGLSTVSLLLTPTAPGQVSLQIANRNDKTQNVDRGCQDTLACEETEDCRWFGARVGNGDEPSPGTPQAGWCEDLSGTDFISRVASKSSVKPWLVAVVVSRSAEGAQKRGPCGHALRGREATDGEGWWQKKEG